MTNSVGLKKICIIGAGPLGLSAAYYLSQANKNNIDITIFEASSTVGGLAASHKLENGQCIESYYHHIFCSDTSFISLCVEIGLDPNLFFKATSIGHYFNGKLYSIGAPLDILAGNLLSPLNRLRFLLASIFLKTGIRKIFNGETALNGCYKLYGSQCTRRIWYPLLEGKFNNYKALVPMSWLAARIRDRSLKLGYLNGGFELFYARLLSICASRGVSFCYNTRVKSVTLDSGRVFINDVEYDACLSSIGPVNEAKLNFPDPSKSIKYLGAICVVFEIQDDPGLPYWTNYCDPKSPVLAVISHRELDDSDRYGDCYPVYSAAYVAPDSDLFNLSDSEIKTLFLEPIKAISLLADCPRPVRYSCATIYRTKYAQPVINPDVGLPPVIDTAGPLYRASMHSIYPNDRGQNYAIEIGKRMANIISRDICSPQL
jgi:protoporphyrinogen oxidase